MADELVVVEAIDKDGQIGGKGKDVESAEAQSMSPLSVRHGPLPGRRCGPRLWHLRSSLDDLLLGTYREFLVCRKLVQVAPVLSGRFDLHAGLGREPVHLLGIWERHRGKIDL